MTRFSKILILSFILCGAGKVNAQSSFFPGYYITVGGDTVKGFIELRGGNNPFDFFHYRDSPDAKTHRFHPVDVKGYVIADQMFFESMIVTTPKSGTVTGFFRLLQQGRLELLRYQSRYFVRNSAGLVLEITKTSKIVDGNKKQTEYSGLGVMRSQTVDCPLISQAALDKQYAGFPDYEKIVREYNNCVGGSRSFSVLHLPMHVSAGLVMSGAISQFVVNRREDLIGANFTSFQHYNAGAFLTLFIPRTSNSLRFVVEASYGRTSTYVNFENGSGMNDLFLRYSYLRVPVMARFYMRSVFVEGGVYNLMVLNQNNEWRIENAVANSIFTEDGPEYQLSRLTAGPTLGLGARVRLMNIDFFPSIRVSRTIEKSVDLPTVKSVELNLAVGLYSQKYKR